jgi:hypothetical protein
MAICTFLVLTGGSPSSQAEPPGLMKGHLKILSRPEVNLPDAGAGSKTVPAQSYAEYPLIILSENGAKEIARVTADGQGHYRIELPPGEYILDALGRAPKRVRAKPQPFTVVSGQTVRVDMEIDTGIR